MKTTLSVALLAIQFLAPSPCFADWSIVHVSKDQARELGMEVRSEHAGPNHARVELEIKTGGALKRFTEGTLKDFSGVQLRVGDGENPSLTTRLQEDRSKPGRVVVGFTADLAQLEKLTLWVYVPGELGGDIYDLRAKDFIEAKKGR